MMEDRDERMSATFAVDLPAPQQPRSLATQRAFIAAARAILREMPWEAVSIALIARRAERSVGAFYQRFGSKEDFLTALLREWLEDSRAAMAAPIGGETARSVIDDQLAALFETIRTNRYLWRAALQRAMDDPASWEPFRQLGAERRRRFAEGIGAARGRPLDAAERHRLDLAVQVFNSVLNNALLNDPGPLRIDEPEFLPTLRDIFLTVAALDPG